ncbi:hypothetical protein [Rhizobium leguminosarum]|uniref:hypothetical protein n=1 Tax=Rhizobium leguminosarum TaxID=384 RepID=UPI0014425A63|nr:hypothetical protein [Rhizobium leguminosarum]NKL77620.1 hypothetical protein [Rhizobium leguminosarum bv. viciae]
MSLKTRENPIDAEWRAIFGPRHEPARVIKKRTRHPTIPVNHPTKKAFRKGMIRARLPLMSDQLTHLDVTPEVIRVAEYPFAIEYQRVRDEGEFVTRTRVLDLAVLMSDGRVFVIDYEPINIQRRKGFQRVEARTRGLVEALEKKDATYLLLDECSIHLQPRWGNVCEIWKHAHEKGQHPGIAEIRHQIINGALPATIGQLMRRVSPNAMTSRFAHERPEAAMAKGEFNPTYTAVLQLAAAGKVRLDYSKPFDIHSIVTRKV